MLISIDFDDVISPFTPYFFCFHREDITNSRDSVSWAIQTPQISSIFNSLSFFNVPHRRRPKSAPPRRGPGIEVHGGMSLSSRRLMNRMGAPRLNQSYINSRRKV